ncbi:MAG: Hpt domain-containing protein [Oscillospiraceae bacterium]|nr:Hpt domain-containing protein [Oscillospiraceae bacterium]
MTIKELYEQIGGCYESALRTMQMDRLIERFLPRYLDDTNCQKLLDAKAAGDEKGIFEASHAMKGLCANLGLDALSGAASDITEEFRPGKARTMTDTELDAKFAELEELHNRAVSGIRAYTAQKA